MNDLFYLSGSQFERLQPFFSKSHGIPRVDDLKVISGIIHVLKRGLQWCDAPKEYGLHKTLYNHFMRWSEMGVFDLIFTSLASLQRKIENKRSLTTRNCTGSATKSKTCLGVSRTGSAYQPGTTDAFIDSFLESAPQLSSYGGFNEP